jgi:2,3-diketo-5-methylthio-1-phosphopentane phosphatase
MPPLIFCDFDGTIMRSDTCLELCAHFADSSAWLGLEDKWQDRKVGSIEMARAVLGTIHAPLSEILSRLEQGEVCAGFADFARFCREHTLPLIIVSDGYDAIIKRVLERLGLFSLPVYSNILFDFPQKHKLGLSGDFPHANAECLNCACCKRTITSRVTAAAKNTGAAWQSVLIGDGRSDYCAAGYVDSVFAKGKLAEFCCRENIPFTPWEDFNDILAHPIFVKEKA